MTENREVRKEYTQRELAGLLGVSVSTVRRWSRNGCPRVYIGQATSGAGSRPRYNVEEVRAWLHERSSAGKGVEA